MIPLQISSSEIDGFLAIASDNDDQTRSRADEKGDGESNEEIMKQKADEIDCTTEYFVCSCLVIAVRVAER